MEYVDCENQKRCALKQMQFYKHRFSDNEFLKGLCCKWNFYNNFSYIVLCMIHHRKIQILSANIVL